MKNILLLTDFSENSINAMQYALNLFKGDMCHFFVLNVQNSNTYISDDLILAGNKSIYNSIVEKSKHKLTKLINGFKSKFKHENYNYHTLVDFDVLTDATNQIIKSKPIDLIVMGTNGVTGAKEVLFGSNTINVIRKVDCPTLVIPEGFKYRQPTEVLLPLDAFDAINDNNEAFMNLLKFTTDFSKKLHVLRIIPRRDDLKAVLKDEEHIALSLKEIMHEYHVINSIPTQYAVSCYTQTHRIDLIALLVQKEHFFERFFTGSSTTEISNKSRVPLLVFHS